MKETGTIDRIEGLFAVVLYGTEEQHKIDIPLQELPKGVREGKKVVLTFENEKVIDIAINEDATRQAKERVQSLIEKIAKKKR
jgi:hypothetical protein